MYYRLRLLSALVFLVVCDQALCKKKTTEYAYGAMEVSSDLGTVPICLDYPLDYFNFLPSVTFTLENRSDLDLCTENLTMGELEVKSPKTLFLLRADGNCSVSHNFQFVPKNASGLILISKYMYSMNRTSYSLDIFAVMNPKSIYHLWNSSSGHLYVRLYGGGGFDGSTVVLGIIAIICVIIGSYSGPYGAIPGYRYFRSANNEPSILDGSESNTEGRLNGVTISITTVVVLVVFITVTLLSLYFFYKYLVYFFILIFCIASTRATYCIFLQILCYFDFGITIPKIKNYGLHEILLAGTCVSITVVWFIFRHYSFSWILQDFLGICFCVHIIQTLRLPNLKICTVLLSLLFVYDIFFVFITPLFMQDGKSIMVEVATGTGSNSSETIPLLLKVPRLQRNPAADCSPAQYSLLGFGDIIIPGFLVCFAHTFDIMSGAKFRPYFISTSIGYSFGLFGAFVALYLMSTGQPALLYIVPSVLLAIFMVGVCRKEMKAVWIGSVLQVNAVSDIGT